MGFQQDGVDDGDAIIFKMTLYEREGSFGYRSVANHTDILYVAINFLCFHLNYLNYYYRQFEKSAI